MASPQTENGFTKIANEILEKMCLLRLSSYETAILLCLLRKTYGYNKKEDWISLSQFSKATNIARSHVCRTLNLLIERKIVTKRGNTYSPKYRFNKDYEQWVVLPNGVTDHSSVTKRGNQVLPNGAHTKENIQKKSTDAEASLSIKSKQMRIHNENDHQAELPEISLDTGEIVSAVVKKVKQPKNQLALGVQRYFNSMAEKNTGTKPIESGKGYFVVLQSINRANLTNELLKQRIEDWFSSGQPAEKLVQITNCFSEYAINDWKAKNGIK